MRKIQKLDKIDKFPSLYSKTLPNNKQEEEKKIYMPKIQRNRIKEDLEFDNFISYVDIKIEDQGFAKKSLKA